MRPQAAAAEPHRRTLPVEPDDPLHTYFLWHASCESPPRWTVELPGARAFGEGVVITATNEVLSDVSVDYRAGSGRHRLCGRGRLPRPRRLQGGLAVAAVAEGSNYFHWLFEAVPRLALLADAAPMPVLVQSDRAFQQEWLALLGVQPQQVVSVTKHGHWLPDTLHVPAQNPPYQGVHPDTCELLRDVARRTGVALGTKRSDGRKLFVTRGGARHRRLIGEADLEEALARRGFETVDPGLMTARQQIGLFSDATHVVAPHGAALSNLVFCPRGIRVVELFAPGYVNPCFWTVVEALDGHYAALLGEGELPPAGPPRSIREDITIRTKSVLTALDRIDA